MSAQPIDAFLSDFSHRCGEFGHLWDRYSTHDVSLKDITTFLGESIAKAEFDFQRFQPEMTPQQLKHYLDMHTALDSMAESLIETETRRFYKLFNEEIKTGAYFTLETSYNNFCSTLHMIFSNISEKQRRGCGQKIAEIQLERELSQELIRIVQDISLQIRLPQYAREDFTKLKKSLERYGTYLETLPPMTTLPAWNSQVLKLFREHLDYLEQRKYFDDRALAFQHIAGCWPILDAIAEGGEKIELGKWVEAVRPPTPEKQLKLLFEEILKGQEEDEVYGAVIAFKDFAKTVPEHPDLLRYKEQIVTILKDKGLL